MFDIKDKKVVLTGSCGIIGSVLEETLSGLCGELITIDIKDGKSKKHIVSDLSKVDSIDQVFKKTGHGIDAWINCHYPKHESWKCGASEAVEEHWKGHLWDHLGSYCYLSHRATDHLNSNGSLINFSSVHANYAPIFDVYSQLSIKPLPPAYMPIKSGILSFSKYLAALYAKKIRVNCISPGPIEDGLNNELAMFHRSRSPSGELVRAADLVGLIVFLISNASLKINGQDFIIDGGRSVCY